MLSKKIIKKLTFILLIIIFLSSCTSKKTEETSDLGNKINEDRLKIVTSIYPMYDFTKKIVEDKAYVENIIPIGTQSHGWEPTPNDIIKLNDADMFIYNGAGMEPWVDDVLNSINNDDLIVVEASKGVELIESTHDHSHEDEHDHNHEDDEDDHHGHSHGKYDPHVWISLKNSALEMKNIKNAVSEKDVDNKEFYEQNFAKYEEILVNMDNDFSQKASNFASKYIVVSHEAFGYLCEDYRLEQVGIEGIYADSEPNPQKMKEIIDFIKENKVRVVFYESSDKQKVAKAVADEAGIGIALLNPFETLTKEQIDNGEDYISVMQNNFDELEKALN